MAAWSVVDKADWTLERAPVGQPTAAPAGRGLLARLGDFCLNWLDLYVRGMGVDGPEPQATQPPVLGTPYMGPYSEASMWRYGARYRRWGP